MDDVEGVDVSEAGEEVVEVGYGLLGSQRTVIEVVEEGVKVEREEGKDESEFAAGGGEGTEKGEDVRVAGGGKDAGFAEGIVGSGAL